MALMRTVVLENRAANIITEAEKAYPRIRDMYDALEWRISRQPESGALLAGFDPPRRVVHSLEWPGFPGSLVLVYTHDENEVTVIGARIIPPASAKIAQIKSA